jgi:adenine-specific DNA-methyltransferase
MGSPLTVTKRELLATLSKPELLDIGRRFELDVNAKMTKDDLLDRIAPSERAELARILPALAYESLKAACKELGLPGDGREKAAFVARLLAAATPAGQPVPQVPAHSADDFTMDVSVEPRKPRVAWQGMDRKEAVISVPTQVVEIVRPGRARNRGATLLNTDVRFANERPSSEPVFPPNRLIWTNDNLVALQTLLDEKDPVTKGYRYRAQVDLVYIDPPFMVNSDFRTDNTIDIEIDEDAGVEAKKEPSLVEHLAYRDTWRQGLDSFLSMLKRRLELLKELLAPTGSIYVHLDWHAVHYVKVLMDEIFGYENFRDEIIWQKVRSSKAQAKHFSNCHDTILAYCAGPDPFFEPVFVDKNEDLLGSHYRHVDETGKRYNLDNFTQMGPGPARRFGTKVLDPPPGKHWIWSQERIDEGMAAGLIVFSSGGVPYVKRYFDDVEGNRATDLWTDVFPVNQTSKEKNDYPTQKPVALVDRIIRGSCPPGGLVLDCFLGSGTTSEAAERLGRRWIGIDNGKYAVHLARKRLIELHGQPRPPEKTLYEYVECDQCKNIERKEKAQKTRDTFVVRPFTVENVGVYQRAEQWQDFQSQKSRYRDEMIKVFGGEPSGLGQFLHGRKDGQWVHVGPLDGAVSVTQIWSIAREAARTDTKAVTVLSADFDTLSAGEKEAVKQKTGVHVTIRVIPISAIDEVRRRIEMMRVGGERAVESMAIPAFYAPLSIVLAVATTGRIARVTLERCEIDIQSFLQSQRPALKPLSDGMSATARKKAAAEREKWEAREKELNAWLRRAETWQKFIDFWAIDWDYGHRTGNDEKPIFESEWQSFRLRKSNEVEPLTFTAEFKYAEPGQYRIGARVTDVFGNDGIATVSCEVA